MPEDGPAADRTKGDRTEAGLDELRDLLLRDDRRSVVRLREDLESSCLNVERLSLLLPEAATRSRQESKQLGHALFPVVEEAIDLSVTRNPKKLANAIFPVIGPAIRKSIAEAISSMVQAFNQTLEHSLSPRSLRWRTEAWRTGRPFAEVVLLHSLLYRVEQVFLIHRPSGLLLMHVQDPLAGGRDADLMSGMLSAIQDFVKDSLDVEAEASLESFRVGDLEIWVESGSNALLAAVLRGKAPVKLREQFQDVLATIHRDRGEELATFEGDAGLFESLRPDLEECLVHVDASRGEQKASALRWIPVMLPLLALAFFLAWWIRDRARFDRYIELLEAEPGLFVVSAEYGWSQHEVSGLRDPVAEDPAVLLERAGVSAAGVTGQWQSVLVLEDAITLRRARALLDPPTEVRLSLDAGCLDASGRAGHAWIERLRERAHSLPGVFMVEEQDLVDVDREIYGEMRDALEARSLEYWQPDSPASAVFLDEIARALEDAVRQAAVTGQAARVVVVEATSSDPDGSGRAGILASGLQERGIRAGAVSWPDREAQRAALRLPADPLEGALCVRLIDTADAAGDAP